MIKNKLLKKIFLVGVLLNALVACNQPASQGDYEIIEKSYNITYSTLLLNQKIGMISPVINVTGTSKISATPTWIYKNRTGLVFFEDDCLFTREEAEAYMSGHESASEKYRCEGTKYYSYEPITDQKKGEIGTLTYECDTTGLTGLYALYYITDLYQYLVTPKDGRDPFNVYSSAGWIGLSLEPYDRNSTEK